MPTESINQREFINRRIDEYEREGKFDVDVNIDPPTRPLTPGEVDYKYRKFSTRFKTKIANACAYLYFENLIRKGNLVIDGVEGLENFNIVKGGAIITCNHFNAFDNYAIYRAIRKNLHHSQLYKIIREGNYTSFPGLYGFFFRHCNTLPLASNYQVVKEFLDGVQYHLKNGHKILIYPEQAMWLNYKKPRPFKSGAFKFAVEANVPVIPMFISLRDTDKLDGDGYPIQAYMIHIMPPLQPDESLDVKDRIEKLRYDDYELSKAKYEEVYGEKLSYSNEVLS